jgi:hypothetical protein
MTSGDTPADVKVQIICRIEDFCSFAADTGDKVTGLRKMASRNLWSGALSNERVGNYSNAWISNGSILYNC